MYNKIFTKILDSSIWLEPDSTRIVWVTCIAAMDEDGFVQMASVANMARRANVSLTAAQKAVERLEGPDPASSDPDNDGRRLERVQGGWMVLNATKYRELVTREIAKAQTRERVRRHRANKPVTNSNAELRNTNGKVTPSEAVSEARSEEKAVERTPTTPKGRPLPGFRRLKIFRWMVDDLIAILGGHLESFDLEAWLQAIDLDDSRVIPEDWRWLKTELVAECRRRQFPLAGETPTKVSDVRLEYDAWKIHGCPHTPRCSNFTTCQLVSSRVHV